MNKLALYGSITLLAGATIFSGCGNGRGEDSPRPGTDEKKTQVYDSTFSSKLTTFPYSSIRHKTDMSIDGKMYTLWNAMEIPTGEHSDTWPTEANDIAYANTLRIVKEGESLQKADKSIPPENLPIDTTWVFYDQNASGKLSDNKYDYFEKRIGNDELPPFMQVSSDEVVKAMQQPYRIYNNTENPIDSVVIAEGQKRLNGEYSQMYEQAIKTMADHANDIFAKYTDIFMSGAGKIDYSNDSTGIVLDYQIARTVNAVDIGLQPASMLNVVERYVFTDADKSGKIFDCPRDRFQHSIFVDDKLVGDVDLSSFENMDYSLRIPARNDVTWEHNYFNDNKKTIDSKVLPTLDSKMKKRINDAYKELTGQYHNQQIDSGFTQAQQIFN